MWDNDGMKAPKRPSEAEGDSTRDSREACRALCVCRDGHEHGEEMKQKKFSSRVRYFAEATGY